MLLSIIKSSSIYNSRAWIYNKKYIHKLCSQNAYFKHVNKYLKLYQQASYNTLEFGTSFKTHTCGELSTKDIGEEVLLRGFLQYQRMGLFCVIRDSYGITQIIVDNNEISSTLKETTFESYVEISGEVKLRPQNQINEKMKTGHIEVLAKKFNVINCAKKDIPFLIRHHNQPNEKLRLTYRYLDLRHGYLQENLRFRSKIGKKIRDYLQDEVDFIELTTPTLSVNTPGGAQEFIVPTQLQGNVYSLVQSPQLYKQLAVIGGFEKYFQFAVCYRDEGGKPDRQPEFMQLDIEMADASIPEVQKLLENVIVSSWPKEYPTISGPFPSLTYDEAVECYGTDKPDLRFEWKILDVTRILEQSDSHLFSNSLKGNRTVAKAFVISNGGKYVKKSHIEVWEDIARKETDLPGVISLYVQENFTLKGAASKALSQQLSEQLIKTLNANAGDSIILSIGHRSRVLKLLGKLRLLGAKVLEDNEIEVRKWNAFNFVWINDFPLFELDESTENLVSCHHPFTAPHPDHARLLYDNPLQVKSQHYDLVLNGCEIAGGSIRIHEAAMQKHVLDILNIDSTKLSFLLEALACGAPPHGGIALGFDRYVSILRGSDSVRDVMAFPKTAEGKCLMSGAPELVSDVNKKLYHL